jgi:DNA-binding NtrC family response regulator
MAMKIQDVPEGSNDLLCRHLQRNAFGLSTNPRGLIADEETECLDQKVVRRALDQRKALARIGITYPQDILGFGDLIGKSDCMRTVFTQIRQCAPYHTTLLITGESGTGKELVARAIHEHSLCSNGPFMAVNCSALPRELVESQLFGHEEGAFTGAVRMHKGVFEAASGGTLFLDEIGDLEFEAQAKLLRALETRQVVRVGSTEPINVDVRLITATNTNLKSAVRNHRFRESLYYRINVLHISLPPLRARRDDIPLLTEVFQEQFARENDLPDREIAQEALAYMMAYDWPGNVRELKNITERLLVMARYPVITSSELLGELQDNHTLGNVSDDAIDTFVGMSLEEVERLMIGHTLEKTDGNRAHAAKILGISLRTLQRRLKDDSVN